MRALVNVNPPDPAPYGCRSKDRGYPAARMRPQTGRASVDAAGLVCRDWTAEQSASAGKAAPRTRSPGCGGEEDAVERYRGPARPGASSRRQNP